MKHAIKSENLDLLRTTARQIPHRSQKVGNYQEMRIKEVLEIDYLVFDLSQKLGRW